MKLRCAWVFAGLAVVLMWLFTSPPALASEKGDSARTSLIQPPAVLSPADREEIIGIFKVSFAWKEAPGAEGYHFVLAKDRRFKKVVYEERRIPGTSCAVDNLDYGTYFFKISSVATDGSEGPFSDVLTFVVVPPPPAKTLK